MLLTCNLLKCIYSMFLKKTNLILSIVSDLGSYKNDKNKLKYIVVEMFYNL